MITLENLPPRHLAQPMATLVASLDPPLHSLPLSFKFHEQPTLTLLHLAGPALPSPHPLLTAPLSRSPSDILYVVAHSNSIFPSFVTLDTLYSMFSGVGNQSPYTKHHSPSSIRDNQSRRPRFVLHSADKDWYCEFLDVQLYCSWCNSRVISRRAVRSRPGEM